MKAIAGGEGEIHISLRDGVDRRQAVWDGSHAPQQPGPRFGIPAGGSASRR